MKSAGQRGRRALTLTTAALLVAAGGLLATAAPASAADPLPSPAPLLQRDSNVVTSDNLPTVQINDGYVWAQTMIGNTVYAVGSFTNVRPAGAAVNSNLTPRANILAYDITTGNLITTFAPTTNGPVKAIAASPDGKRIYIGGSFNTVNNQTRYNFAALDATTGALVPGFTPSVGGTGVYALAAAGNAVYLGGLFSQANSTPRQNLAAFNVSNGALLPWAPTTDRQVDAMVMEPGNEKVIVGGRFYQTNAQVQRGLAALDPVSGDIITSWQAPQTIINGWSSGSNAGRAGIFALNADSHGVYGTGWVLADVTAGNLEGVFAANAGDGSIRWVADCHGDHYGVYSTGSTVYSTSHTHQCDTVGLAPELSPRTYRYAEAFTADARGILTRSPSVSSIYKDWSGTPSPSAYAWYPDFTVGTTSGLGQAGLSVTGNGDFVSVGGEFGSVNNRLVQGLVRFAVNPASGAKDGPRLNTTTWAAPSALSVSPGSARISIPANWDRDDRDLTYELRRSGTSTPVATKTVASTWWKQPTVTLVDSGLTPGSSQTYTVRVKDGDGNLVNSQPVTVTIASGNASAYGDKVLEDGAGLYYRLGGVTDDWSGTSAPLYGSGVTTLTPGAIDEADSAASTFSGSADGNGRVSSTATVPTGDTFSTEIWFNTTTNRGGKLIGYGSSRTGSSGSYDRQIYMANNGRLVFGVYPGAVRTVSSTAAYNDGAWHHVVATLGADGMKLYVDGALVGSDSSTTSAQAYSGYWRIGGDNLSGWTSQPTSQNFAGALDEAAVYSSVLTPGQVASHYAVGMGMAPPTAAFTSSASDLEASFDASTSTVPSGRTITGYDWDFGDGTTGTGVTVSHPYQQSGTYSVTLTVTDSAGLTSATTTQVTVLAANVPPVARFTTTVSGMTVAANGATSSDADGTVTEYSWDWGDGTPKGTGVTASHAYATEGAHTVELTVTDDRGGTHTESVVVTTTHAAPTADFTTVVSGLTASVDGAASAAADGATLSYSWNWGDGTPSGSGATAAHAYATAGTRTITLTVTDSFGKTATKTASVTVSSVVYAASDSFERSVASGWGAADIGGTWSTLYGSAAAGSVADGVGKLNLPAGQTRNMALNSLSLRDSQQSVAFSMTAPVSTGNVSVGLTSRQSATNDYTLRAWMQSNGAVWLVALKSGTTLTSVPIAGLTWAPGDVYVLKSEVSGVNPTTLRAKVWKRGAAEPSSWQLTTTDSTSALQAAGYSSVQYARAGSATAASTVSFDDYRVVDLQGGATANTPPTASFTSTTSDLTVSVNGSASSDAEGPVASYQWVWGDSKPDGSGATATHAYDAAGTYSVKLTVTDAGGLTHSLTKDVTVTAAPPDPEPDDALASDGFGRTIASGWGTADKGGAWTFTSGSAASGSIVDGKGAVSLPAGQTRFPTLQGVSARDVEVTVDFALAEAPASGSAYAGVVARQLGGDDNYQVRAWMQANGAVWIVAQRGGTVLSTYALPGTRAAGDTYTLKAQVFGSGTATIRAKLWKAGTTEPTSWQLTTTDSTAALQVAGSVALYAYRAGSATAVGNWTFDNFVAKAL